MPHNIVIGQTVRPELVERAKELRRNMTPEEVILWQQLRRNQLGGFDFRRQQIINHYIADLYCQASALVIELDGGIHEQNKERDQARAEIIGEYDLLVLRFKNEEIQTNLARVLKEIERLCAERADT